MFILAASTDNGALLLEERAWPAEIIVGVLEVRHFVRLQLARVAAGDDFDIAAYNAGPQRVQDWLVSGSWARPSGVSALSR